jgi:phage/plasmid-like protein (TIGR03299 family)
MAANVETMFYVREVPWHGLGVSVDSAPTSEEALHNAGLDWMVEQKPIHLYCGIERQYEEIPGYLANTRNTDNAVFGIVSKQYKIIQNTDAFDFTDALLGMGSGEITYETAGSLNGGRTVWLLARMPERIIVGDSIQPYLVFTNSHDGKSSAKAFITPIRVVCNNTLNMAIRSADRMWSTTHTGDIKGKMDEARRTLAMYDTYMDHLRAEADKLAMMKIQPTWLDNFIAQLMPIKPEFSDIRIKMVEESRALLKEVYNTRPDLSNLRGSAWGIINAVADFSDHRPFGPTTTVTNRTYERKFESIISGADMLDLAYSIVRDAA